MQQESLDIPSGLLNFVQQGLMMDVMYTPEAIKSLRESTGLTVREFGKRLGISGSMVSRYEKAKSHPSYRVMCRLNDLDVSLRENGERQPA